MNEKLYWKDKKSFIIDFNGEYKEIVPEKTEDGTPMPIGLERMYELIGCRVVQMCDSFKQDYTLVFDEEFTFRHNWKDYLNRRATSLMHERMGPFQHNVIAGKCLVLHNSLLR